MKDGFHVAGMDFPGHGRSDGLHVDIPSFDPIIDDLLQFIDDVRAELPPNLPLFLFSESMGGAIAFLLSTRHPSLFAGSIFCSPMCQIAPDMTPPRPMVQGLLLLMRLFPRLPITPTPDVADLTFKRPEVWEQVKTSVVYYNRMPRLSTAANMLFSSLAVAEQLHDLRLPFLICHGEDDRVTDPRMSQRMHDEAASTDKTLKVRAVARTRPAPPDRCGRSCTGSHLLTRICLSLCSAVSEGVAFAAAGGGRRHHRQGEEGHHHLARRAHDGQGQRRRQALTSPHRSTERAKERHADIPRGNTRSGRMYFHPTERRFISLLSYSSVW